MPLSIGVVIPGSVRLAFWGGSVYTTPSGEAQDWGFPHWLVEGNEVGSLTSSTPRATDIESTVRKTHAPQETPSVQSPIVQTAFAIWDVASFSGVAYQVTVEMFRERALQSESEGSGISSDWGWGNACKD